VAFGHVYRVAAGAGHGAHLIRLQQMQSPIRSHTKTGERATGCISGERKTPVMRQEQPTRRILFGWNWPTDEIEIP